MGRVALALLASLALVGCFLGPSASDNRTAQDACPGCSSGHSACGDGLCANGEDCRSCPLDCGTCPVCWDASLNSESLDSVWSTAGHSNSAHEASCGGGGSGPDLALRWVAPARGHFEVSLVNPDFEALLQVQSDGCPGRELGCADLGSGQSSVAVSLERGEAIIIVIDGVAGASGAARLQVRALPSVCGDGSCDGQETCATCASDCGSCGPLPGGGTLGGGESGSPSLINSGGEPATLCGDGRCEGGEDASGCPADCGEPGSDGTGASSSGDDGGSAASDPDASQNGNIDAPADSSSISEDDSGDDGEQDWGDGSDDSGDDSGDCDDLDP